MIALKATLVTASDTLRAELEYLSNTKLISACAGLMSATDVSDPDAAMRHVPGALARRWQQVHEVIKLHSRHLKNQTKALVPALSKRSASGSISLQRCSSPRVTIVTASALGEVLAQQTGSSDLSVAPTRDVEGRVS